MDSYPHRDNDFFFIIALSTLTSLLLLSHVFAQTSRPQNLCRDARERGSNFAADPSDCSRYLFCDNNGVTHTRSCAIEAPTLPFFSIDRCVSTNHHCTPLSTLCPQQGEMDIMVKKAIFF